MGPKSPHKSIITQNVAYSAKQEELRYRAKRDRAAAEIYIYIYKKHCQKDQ